MKTINRDHLFYNRLNYVKKGKKYFYLKSEKSKNYIYMPITKKGIEAFENQDWDYFENLDMQGINNQNIKEIN